MISQWDKAIAAAVMGILSLGTLLWGAHGLDWITEEWIIGIIAVITPLIVWAVPNRPATVAQLVHRE